jgi:hypothetical protein
MLCEKIKFSLLLAPCYLVVNLGIRCNITLICLYLRATACGIHWIEHWESAGAILDRMVPVPRINFWLFFV